MGLSLIIAQTINLEHILLGGRRFYLGSGFPWINISIGLGFDNCYHYELTSNITSLHI